MMKGSTDCSLGITSRAASQRRLSRALRLVASLAHQARAQDTLEILSHILHQILGIKGTSIKTKKLLRIWMINGCSRLVTGYASMPVKSPILIYEFVVRPHLCRYGIWDQIRIDHRREFNFVNFFVQQLLSVHRN